MLSVPYEIASLSKAYNDACGGNTIPGHAMRLFIKTRVMCMILDEDDKLPSGEEGLQTPRKTVSEFHRIFAKLSRFSTERVSLLADLS